MPLPSRISTPIGYDSALFELQGEFNANMFCLARKQHGIVVICTQQSGLAHQSLSVVNSALGVIPSRFRPGADAENVFAFGSSVINRVRVGSDGSVNLVYRNYSGALTARTAPDGQIFVTYVVDV